MPSPVFHVVQGLTGPLLESGRVTGPQSWFRTKHTPCVTSVSPVPSTLTAPHTTTQHDLNNSDFTSPHPSLLRVFTRVHLSGSYRLPGHERSVSPLLGRVTDLVWNNPPLPRSTTSGPREVGTRQGEHIFGSMPTPKVERPPGFSIHRTGVRAN